MRYSRAEENYLKAIYKLSRVQMNDVSTKAIGELLQIKPPTVSDMLKKLAVKKLANYEKYKGVSLTQKGELHALKVIRKHRLWETFLVEKLDFTWDKVHDIAEQLEHIHSTDLVNRLDKFLNFPKFDPHGDPIPDENGVIELRHEKTLDSIANGSTAVMVGVKDHSPEFLKYLDSMSLNLGCKIQVIDKIDFDNSIRLQFQDSSQHQVSQLVAQNVIVK